jgi:hypothetical protein
MTVRLKQSQDISELGLRHSKDSKGMGGSKTSYDWSLPLSPVSWMAGT